MRLAAYALAGFCVGGAMGYMFMGTAHAVRSPRLNTQSHCCCSVYAALCMGSRWSLQACAANCCI